MVKWKYIIFRKCSLLCGIDKIAAFYPLFDEFAENIANFVFGKEFYLSK